jgi:hypothetical protein
MEILQFFVNFGSQTARAVSLRPKFARAWGCLAAIYKKTGQVTQQKQAAMTFLSIEKNPEMKRFIEQEFLS